MKITARSTSRIRRAAVGGAIVLGTLLATAVPAHAATGYNRCPANRICLFVNANGGGPYASFQTGSADLRNPISGYVFDNKFSSAWNRTGNSFCGYAGYNYTFGNVPNRVFLFNPGDRGNIGAPFNDNISSLMNCRA